MKTIPQRIGELIEEHALRMRAVYPRAEGCIVNLGGYAYHVEFLPAGRLGRIRREQVQSDRPERFGGE